MKTQEMAEALARFGEVFSRGMRALATADPPRERETCGTCWRLGEEEGEQRALAAMEEKLKREAEAFSIVSGRLQATEDLAAANGRAYLQAAFDKAEFERRLADALRENGVVPGRNPDGVNDDPEKAGLMLQAYRERVEELEAALRPPDLPSGLEQLARSMAPPVTPEEGKTWQMKQCGRVLVGRGSDVADPVCVAPTGHAGRCLSEVEYADWVRRSFNEGRMDDGDWDGRGRALTRSSAEIAHDRRTGDVAGDEERER